MGNRHAAVGIKQVIRLEWMRKSVNLLLSGMDAKAIREELREYLGDRKGSVSGSRRGETSRDQAVSMLMRIWIRPDEDLIPLRDSIIETLGKGTTVDSAAHWGMVSAAYPFWYQAALQTGRLFSLQDKVTKNQIIGRLTEQYGDRETVVRYARSVIRSFVAWGVLRDSEIRGCYEKAPAVRIENPCLPALLCESLLHALPEGRADLRMLLENPSLFPFSLGTMNGNSFSHLSGRIEINSNGLDGTLLRLRT